MNVKHRYVVITSAIDGSVLNVTYFGRTLTNLDQFNSG